MSLQQIGVIGAGQMGAGIAQVAAQVIEGRPAPEPVAVVNAVNDQSRLEHERVRDHRVVKGVGVLLDIEILLHLAAGVGQEGPLRAH